MRKLTGVFFVLMMVGIVGRLEAQTFRAMMKAADKQYELKAFNLAADSYLQALRREPNDPEALGKLADCYFHLNRMEDAAKYFSMAVSQKKVDAQLYLKYGKVLMAIGQYDAARRSFIEFAKERKTEGEHYAQSCEFAKKQQNTAPSYQVTNEFINTSSSEFGPAVYGNQVVFSSARMDIQRTSSNWEGKSQNQLFVAGVGANGSLESPFFLKPSIRNAFNEGPVSFAGNRTIVAYTKNNFVDGTRQIPSGGLELSLHIADVSPNGDWLNSRPFPYNGNNYSTAYPSFTPDGNTLYFASDRPDGFGGFDIYMCYKTGNTWSTPENLGPIVNSPGNEVSPSIDANTLYFSSDWHNGLGGYDIFKAEQTNNRWARISHMGNGVNSSYDDYNFIFEGIKNLGYLTSNRPGGRGAEDIYKVSKAADNIVLQIKNASDGSPIANTIVDFSACGEGVYQSDNQGIYSFQASIGLNCNVLIRKDGFISYNLPLNIASMGTNKTVEIMLARLGEEYLGKVLNYSNARPAIGVTVIATNQVTGMVTQTQSDPNGDYRLALSPNSKYMLRYSSPGYLDLNRSLATSPGFDPLLLGTVSMIPTGAPIPDDPGNTAGSSSVYIPSGFAVQVAAVSRADMPAFSKLSPIGQVYSKNENGVSKIRVGVFNTRQEAESALKRVKASGYKTAFIINEQGTGTPPAGNVDTTPKSGQPLPSAGAVYKVQLGAFSKPQNFNSKGMEAYGVIQDFKKGNLTLKLLGDYTNKNDALNALAKAKALGFSGAFLLTEEGGQLARVK